jgi:hypothetical protein
LLYHPALALTALLASGACTQQPSSADMGRPVSITRVPQDGGAFSGYEQPITLVVRDREAWQSTWSQVYRGRNPVPPLPPVDFSTEVIVVAALGAQPTSGYAVEFNSAHETNGTVTVEATSVSPGTRCITVQVITYPFDIARLTRRDGAVQFHFTPRVTSC